jgi:hypothetical protein
MRFFSAVTNASAAELPQRMDSSILLALGSAAPSAAQFSTELLVGAGQILSIKHELDELRLRCDRHDDVSTDIDYFLSYKAPRNGRPVVVTFRAESQLAAAVLFHQVRFAWVGSGLCCGGDSAGDGLVIAPAAEGEAFLRRAIEELVNVQKKFHTIRVRVKSSRTAPLVDFETPGLRSKFVERTVKHRLTLAESYPDMLAGFGLRTRRSLRTKRRQLEDSLRPDFFPGLAPEQAFEAICYLRQRASLPSRSMWYFEGRRKILHAHPDAFAMGLKAHDGTWLSILCGWRRNGTTYIDVQLNHSSFVRESVSAVMRAFLLEYEISIGQKSIVFVGGCSALLERYCSPHEPIVDLVVTRFSLRGWCFKRAIGMFHDPSFEQWVYLRGDN